MIPMKKYLVFPVALLICCFLASCSLREGQQPTTADARSLVANSQVAVPESESQIQVTATPTTEQPAYPKEIVERGIRGYTLGETTPEQLVAKLKAEGAKIWVMDPEYPDGRFYSKGASEFHYLHYSYQTDTTIYGYNRNDELSKIFIWAGDEATALGAKLGDSEATIKALYGDDFQYRVSESTFIEYTDGKTYLTFSFDNGILRDWAVSDKTQLDFPETVM
jgi:hypothetical protein